MILESGTAIMPLSVIPPISWFAIVSLFHRIELEVKETYPKQTIRNHYYLATANGTLKCSIPVSKPSGNKTRTEEVLIGQESWPRAHWRAIESAYSNSAYFIHYADEIKRIFSVNAEETLVDLAIRSNQYFIKRFNLPVGLGVTKMWFPFSSFPDLRLLFSSQELTVPVSSYEVNTGLFPKRIKHDTVSAFLVPGLSPSLTPISLTFSAYFQNFSDKYGFVGNLSVLDLLFNLGPESRDYLIALGRQFAQIFDSNVIDN